ncbi:hypothetical protein [Acetobacter syzygii]|uniref:hypothetical protein n=1 Tax=Acetobacter syzygii TaxID=146476 RepID=UPI0020C7469F|nr:hypothetical protein [Acetobacter syzygii]
MTLVAILVPLVALCVVARGVGFLLLTGVVTALAMLLDGLTPLQEAGASLALLFAIAPPVFLTRYQHDATHERSGTAVPFFALGLMVLLLLGCGRAGSTLFPAGLCAMVAGLVTVVCRQSMVWQWAGLLTCIEGVLLSAVLGRQPVVLGVAALAGVVVVLLGGMCIHRIMPRVVAAHSPARQSRRTKPATGGKDT